MHPDDKPLALLRAEDDLQQAAALNLKLKEASLDVFSSLTFPTARDLLFDVASMSDVSGATAIIPPVYQLRQGYGEYIPVYRTEFEVRNIRDRMRIMGATNEFVLCAVENRVNYLIGDGFKYTATPKDINRSECVNAARRVQAVIDKWMEINDTPGLEAEALRRWDIEGEFFPRNFRDADGWLHVRFVEPEHVTYQQAAQSDPQNSFGIVTAYGDIETIEGFHVVRNPNENLFDTEVVSAVKMMQVKQNVPRNAKRGISTFYPVERNLRRCEELLGSMTSMAKARAKVALIRKITGLTSANAETLLARLTAIQVTDPTTSETLNIERLRDGTVLTASGNTEYEFPSGQIGASDYVAVLQAELRAIASRLQMPEWMFTALADAKYSNAFIVEAPTLKKFRRDQWILRQAFGLNRYKGRRSLLWRQLYAMVDAGMLSRSDLDNVTIGCDGPSLEARDRAGEVERHEKLIAAQLESKETAQRLLELDPECENPKIARDSIGKARPVADMSAVSQVQMNYTAGKLSRAAAGASLMILMGFTKEQAELLLPEDPAVSRTAQPAGGGMGGPGDSGGGPPGAGQPGGGDAQPTVEDANDPDNQAANKLLTDVLGGAQPAGAKPPAAGGGKATAQPVSEQQSKPAGGLQLREAFTGTVTASNGVVYHYVEGKRVAGTEHEAHVAAHGAASPTVANPDPEHFEQLTHLIGEHYANGEVSWKVAGKAIDKLLKKYGGGVEQWKALAQKFGLSTDKKSASELLSAIKDHLDTHGVDAGKVAAAKGEAPPEEKPAEAPKSKEEQTIATLKDAAKSGKLNTGGGVPHAFAKQLQELAPTDEDMAALGKALGIKSAHPTKEGQYSATDIYAAVKGITPESIEADAKNGADGTDIYDKLSYMNGPTLKAMKEKYGVKTESALKNAILAAAKPAEEKPAAEKPAEAPAEPASAEEPPPAHDTEQTVAEIKSYLSSVKNGSMQPHDAHAAIESAVEHAVKHGAGAHELLDKAGVPAHEEDSAKNIEHAVGAAHAEHQQGENAKKAKQNAQNFQHDFSGVEAGEVAKQLGKQDTDTVAALYKMHGLDPLEHGTDKLAAKIAGEKTAQQSDKDEAKTPAIPPIPAGVSTVAKVNTGGGFHAHLAELKKQHGMTYNANTQEWSKAGDHIDALGEGTKEKKLTGPQIDAAAKIISENSYTHTPESAEALHAALAAKYPGGAEALAKHEPHILKAAGIADTSIKAALTGFQKPSEPEAAPVQPEAKPAESPEHIKAIADTIAKDYPAGGYTATEIHDKIAELSVPTYKAIYAHYGLSATDDGPHALADKLKELHGHKTPAEAKPSSTEIPSADEMPHLMHYVGQLNKAITAGGPHLNELLQAASNDGVTPEVLLKAAGIDTQGTTPAHAVYKHIADLKKQQAAEKAALPADAKSAEIKNAIHDIVSLSHLKMPAAEKAAKLQELSNEYGSIAVSEAWKEMTGSYSMPKTHSVKAWGGGNVNAKFKGVAAQVKAHLAGEPKPPAFAPMPSAAKKTAPPTKGVVTYKDNSGLLPAGDEKNANAAKLPSGAAAAPPTAPAHNFGSSSGYKPTAADPTAVPADPKLSTAATASKVNPAWKEMDAPGVKQKYGALITRTDPATGKVQVLMVKPTNNYDGYAWTFPKGEHDQATPGQTAIKEAGEEAGHNVELTGALPQVFGSQGSSKYAYFVAKSTGESGNLKDGETEATQWVPLDTAHELIGQTEKASGKARDLAILDALKKHVGATSVAADPKVSTLAAQLKDYANTSAVAGTSSENIASKLKQTLSGFHPSTIDAAAAQAGLGDSKTLLQNVLNHVHGNSEHVGFPANIGDALKDAKEIGEGSTGAKSVTTPSGKFAIKDGGKTLHGQEQVANEVASDKIYRLLGASVPASKLYTDASGKKYKVAKWVDGQSLAKFNATATPEQKAQVQKKIQQHFVATALLGNWDAVGLNHDNIKVDANGEPHFIDNGSGFDISATATKKGAAGGKPYNTTVDELHSLLDAGNAPQSASVFKGVTKADVKAQIANVVKQADKIVAATPAQHKATMQARIDHLKQWAATDGKPNAKKLDGGKHGDVWVAPAKGVAYHIKHGLSKGSSPELVTYLNHITPSEASTLDKYTGSLAYHLNTALYGKSDTSDYKDHITNLDGIFEKAAPPSEPIKLRRKFQMPTGTDGKKFQALLERSIKTGTPIKWRNYQSATPHDAPGHYGSGKNTTFVIDNVTEGVIDANPLGLGGEEEILLNRGTFYRITKVENTGYKYTIHMTQVPAAEATQGKYMEASEPTPAGEKINTGGHELPIELQNIDKTRAKPEHLAKLRQLMEEQAFTSFVAHLSDAFPEETDKS